MGTARAQGAVCGIARALHKIGRLNRLVTDLWAPPDSLFARIPGGRLRRRLSDRFHPDLPRERVTSFPLRTLAWEASAALRGLTGDSRSRAQARWWSSTAASALESAKVTPRPVFSYCYEARELFEIGRARGCTMVLGQIDPGPEEDRKVTALVRSRPGYSTPFQPGSPSYYRSWSEECRLAARIIVNSEWSRTALVKAGVSEEKISVCPLVYTPPPAATGWERTFPSRFTRDRPLRLLFLGQCILLRKGIAETIEAAKTLFGEPVEFTFVGNTDISGFEKHFGSARILVFSRASPRAECDVRPAAPRTFSPIPHPLDGFGLTQLEAQAWKLPIIASQFCGQVVVDGRTGWILSEVTSGALVSVIEGILKTPGALPRLSENLRPWPFGLEQLGRSLDEAIGQGRA